MVMNKNVQNQPIHLLELNIKINNIEKQFLVAPTTRLIDILREQIKMTGTKVSCEIGRCGACAVHMDNKLVNSCLMMAYQVNNTSICTIEGIADVELHPIQKAFLEEGGYQCGYCTPGMIMAVKALIDTNSNPTEEEIKEAISGNLCRCTGYAGIIHSIKKAIAIINKNNT
ncbi:(2Fe-2S)-binding protein [Gottfriedia acidiceleris]|uniref:(2Fe-2S)-binding protein n=1 Tax=Gottfriedia acidiceleris TaxID=371036 RepID=UPI00101BF860|nr:2Fe-2S iron-sulfur cluster-binding protein [Gottfriedia acidiceleris]